MWQKLVLTAGSGSQNEKFRKQLTLIPINNYCETVEVVTDESPDVRIGSGGATLSVIRKALENENFENLEKSKILLLHSGGLSQRMPHLSAYGKAFGYLPNRKTILETKLEIYKKDVLDKLPPAGGIMVTASDVIENMTELKMITPDIDIAVFAHSSDIEVGTQHGVFVMDEKSGKLKFVLQKPTMDEMKSEGAIRKDGTVLTDSCYFMTWKFCKKLLEVPLLQLPITQELCCYGDFMRPMGSEPRLDYIDKSPLELAKYRRALADVFKKAKVEISVLGANSFFHFGTYHEYIASLLPNSDFRQAFPMTFKSNVIFSKGIHHIPNSSFVEFSSGVDVELGENCIVSGVDAGTMAIKVPNDTLVFTMALRGVNLMNLYTIKRGFQKTYVTIMIKIEEDIKKKRELVRWNEHDTRINGKSMWDAPLFEMCETRIKSLEATLNRWKDGMAEMVRKVKVTRVRLNGIIGNWKSIDS